MTAISESRPIFTEASYARYRRHCRAKGYCDPFIPYVGSDYGKPGQAKFVYCGGAAWWNEAALSVEDDFEALSKGKNATNQFVKEGMYNTPFWRLFWRLIVEIPGLEETPDDDLLKGFAWTNISKTGIVGQSAPPDNDLELRQFDRRQFIYEMEVLKPDLLVCVSGSLVSSTAYSIFDNSDWRQVESAPPTAPSTWIRWAPWGGQLIWTMHPAYKPSRWYDQVAQDVRACVRRFREKTQ